MRPLSVGAGDRMAVSLSFDLMVMMFSSTRLANGDRLHKECSVQLSWDLSPFSAVSVHEIELGSKKESYLGTLLLALPLLP